jgi:(p)ppGpp synthase/HD superfamily hydrolase
VQGFSPRLDAALVFAARAHREQVRKGSDIPYIIHPVQVSLILLRHGFDEDLAIAGLLHDTVEDTDASLADIAAAFGDEVRDHVAAVTEEKTDDGGERRPWRTRKQEQLDHLARAGARVAALKAADALHNSASTLADLRRAGREVWNRFNAPVEDSLWYYGQVAALVVVHLGDHALARELRETVEEMARLSAPAAT